MRTGTALVVPICGLCILLYSELAAAVSGNPKLKAFETKIVGMAAAGNYSAMKTIAEEEERQWHSTHDISHFAHLVVVSSSLLNGEPDEDRIWYVRVLLWRLILDYSNKLEQTAVFLDYRSQLLSVATTWMPHLFKNAPEKYAVVRKDTVELLFAYAGSLKEKIIPNYQPKPGPWNDSTVTFPDPSAPAPDPAAVAKANRERAERTRNGLENYLQYRVRDELRTIQGRFTTYVTAAYSVGPSAEAELADALSRFGIPHAEREDVLKEVARRRVRK